MSLTFYYSPMSTASVTMLVLSELDIPHERVLVDITKGETKKPEYLKIDPNGRVPVVVHDGVAIFESSAITMYLGEMFGVDKGLYPKPGPRRGEAMKWIAWANVTLANSVVTWLRSTSERAPADERNDNAAEVARREIDHDLGILDGALEGRSYLLGDVYTLADTHLRSFVDWIGLCGVDYAKFSNVDAWAAHCARSPGYKRFQAATVG